MALLALHPGRVTAQEVKWRDAATFEIEGRGWAKTSGPFDRLPDSAKSKVTQLAWDLSKESAGVCIRFVTDASAVSVRWSLTSGSLAMPHMAATGVSGVDLYARSADGSWRFVGNGRPHKQEGNLGKFEFPEGPKTRRECLLYLPVYNGTKSLEIGAAPDAILEKAPPRPETLRQPVVVYGTSIVQGGCASRPGMVWTSILGRMLDRPIINLGFSSAGTMEVPVAEPLAELDPAAYVIDCTWNMGDSAEVYRDRVTKLVQTIRKARPDTPIIFVGQSLFRPEGHPTDLTRRLEAAVQSVQKEGGKGVILVPGRDLIGDDGEATVDGVHLTDIGMARQALALLPIVREAVSGPTKPHVYIDTDTANEIDDPYAVFRALVAPEFQVVGLSSMSWGGNPDFAAGTRKSQKMNEDVLALMQLTDRISHPLGALSPMPDASKPVDSPAARDIIAKAKELPVGEKLQVFVLGAYTNVASALLLDPSLKDKLAVHVMGYNFVDGRLKTDEFNCQGDLNAASYLLKSGVELYAMPANILWGFLWTKADVDAHFKGKEGVRDYLVKRWEAHAPNDPRRILWDIAVFEAILRPKLAIRTEVVLEGSRIQVWTKVDGKAMQADYWAATQPSKIEPVPAPSPTPAAVTSKPQAPPEPIVISKGKEAYGYQAFPDACRLKNGDIVAAFYAGYTHVSLAADDFPLGGRLCIVRSSDEGRTWTEPAVLFDDEDDNRDPHLAQLDDGSLICTFFSIAEKDHKRLKSFKDPKLFDQVRKDSGVQMITSRDNGKTWDTKARSVFPDWVCSAPVRQLPDGTCVLGLYRGDEKTGLSIAGTARSTDRGLTWETPVAIKAPPGIGLNAETDVIRLNDGRLYAAMRSFTDDMYDAISDDEAKSWSEAKKAGFPAHAPHLTRLGTGAIILSHRLPKTAIHVSGNDTKTWKGPFPIDSCIGAYTATVELKDGSVLIVYYTEGGGSVIRARRFKLNADGIEFLPL
ncbi:SGNH/GDSL hydrolase N-terminal domain-containing protein [Singulisphaera sp. GP187]|uniref:SGNH/GDSL hydrolase N-terminal domain-containing protein n=1 Tax=Singulisphaera sp. GP187 TaxID=1882752 RepID=UPI0020B14830|nr:SGNH/GDSL hydrolase family protein [Singulisphaera sp. GP187]